MLSEFPETTRRMRGWFAVALLPLCAACAPILTREFYNNTGAAVRLEYGEQRKSKYSDRVYGVGGEALCSQGRHHSTRQYLYQQGDVSALIVVTDKESWAYRDMRMSDAHLRFFPNPIPGRSWIIRFQIDPDGAIRLIPRGQSFPLPPSYPQPEGFPKYPEERSPLPPYATRPSQETK